MNKQPKNPRYRIWKPSRSPFYEDMVKICWHKKNITSLFRKPSNPIDVAKSLIGSLHKGKEMDVLRFLGNDDNFLSTESNKEKREDLINKIYDYSINELF